MNKLITIHSPDGSTPRYAHGNNALENLMDSEAGIVEVVLGTEFLTIAPLAMLTWINALEMDSEGRIVEVVLGTDERAIIKLGLKTGAAVRMESRFKR